MDLNVLVIDDNQHMRAILRELLRAVGIRGVLEARDGIEGLDLLKSMAPDIILLDYAMPVLDGVEFTRLVRTSVDSANPFVPIIMVTGHSAKPRVFAARDAGVTEFLAKPVTANTLIARLSAVVDKPRPFVKTATYFGPDRRRRRDPEYDGPWRRAEDADRSGAAA